MSTTYDIRQLTYTQKLQSCSHVLTGVIDGVEDAQIEELPTGPRAITIFQVKVVKVEFGASLPRRIAVRVVGGRSGSVTTPWTAAMEPGRHTLFVLAPDYGTRPNQFVPCFGAVYPVAASGQIEPDVATAEELRTLARATDRAKITPRLVGVAAKAAKRTAVTAKGKVQSVELDRVTAFPTEVPVRQIKTMPPATKDGKKLSGKKRPR